LLAFHRVETVLGVVVLTGILAGAVTIWLLPIAVCLALAVPLSWLSARPAALGWLRLDTPDDLAPPAILVAAQKARADYARALRTPVRYQIAAE
jgi:membrane glycosyltransferase